MTDRGTLELIAALEPFARYYRECLTTRPDEQIELSRPISGGGSVVVVRIADFRRAQQALRALEQGTADERAFLRNSALAFGTLIGILLLMGLYQLVSG